MNILLDTHTLLWIITDDSQLSAMAKELYLDKTNLVYFSMAGIWELAIKSSLAKINLGNSIEDFVDNHIKGNDINILDIKLAHILRIEKLPYHHRDPFDRLIIAQAIEEKIAILGNDTIFDTYKIKRIW